MTSLAIEQSSSPVDSRLLSLTAKLNSGYSADNPVGGRMALSVFRIVLRRESQFSSFSPNFRNMHQRCSLVIFPVMAAYFPAVEYPAFVVKLNGNHLYHPIRRLLERDALP